MKTLLFLILLIVTLQSYSQTCQKDLIPKQVNKDWCFDSCQIRQLAVHLNDKLVCDSINKINESIIVIKTKQIQFKDLIINTKDKQLLIKEEEIAKSKKTIKSLKRKSLLIIGILIISIILK